MKISRRNLKILIESYLNEESISQEMSKEDIVSKLLEMQKTMKARGQSYIVGPGIDHEPGDPEVVVVQSLLKKLGKDLGSSGIDGDYGPATAKAIKSFQSDYRELGRPDGKVGKNTIAKMIDAAKELDSGRDIVDFEPAPNPYADDKPDEDSIHNEVDPEVEEEVEEEEEQPPVVSPIKKKVQKLIADGQFDYTKEYKNESEKHSLFKKISVATKSPKFAIGMSTIYGGDIGQAQTYASADARRAGGKYQIGMAPTKDNKTLIVIFRKS